MHCLEGKGVFSKSDSIKAYHQIAVEKSDILKMAVISPIGPFEHNFMTFGPVNATQTFQRFIDQERKVLFQLIVWICFYGNRGSSSSTRKDSPAPTQNSPVQTDTTTQYGRHARFRLPISSRQPPSMDSEGK
ncbi:hypothetical protein TNCT_595441 [Trichonephila clavata]|uniref:Uncharacterized protein n=1 Tax=Trichonephila clavata TaxID=2740835 RepID=A0A8X6LB10_TRICU|nr:hypothetical protein TNCT_595441 [Trichonephila clavata]